MKKRALPYAKLVMVCTQCQGAKARKSCGDCSGEELRDKLKAMVKARKLKGKVRVSKSGCIDRCDDGPNVLVFPDNVWYRGVCEKDLDIILNDISASLDTEAEEPG